MPITNQNILDTAGTLYRSAFDEIFANGAPGVYQTYTEVVPTESKVNEVDVLETMPVVRQWVGPKQFPDIIASNASATVLPYEKSFAIKEIDALTDKTGAIARRMSMFLSPGADGGDIYDKLAFAALVGNGTCYDGTALFNASHPRGPSGATQSNKGTSALSFSTHDSAIQAMTSLRDANGEPLGIVPDTLRVGPKNRKMGQEITQSRERLAAVDNSGAESGTRVAAASIPNVFGGGEMTLIVDPRLVGSYDDYCYYHDTTRGPKPIIGYELVAPRPVEQTQLDHEGRFLNGELRFSVEAYVVFAIGDWHTSYAIIL